MVDAPPGQTTVTLTQTTSNTLTPANSVACPATTVGTAANTYYRVFDLPSLGITGAFNVTSVSFQVEDCESVGSNGAPVAVRVGTYTGTTGGTTLQAGAITILASNNAVQVPETTTGTQVDAPISAVIPAGSKLVVEVDAPDGNNTYQFYIGTSNAGQSAPGYVSSPRCSPPGTTPTDVTTLVTPTAAIDMLLTVTGTH